MNATDTPDLQAPASTEPVTEAVPDTASFSFPEIKLFKLETPDTRKRIHHPLTNWNILGRGETPRTCLHSLLLALGQQSPRAFESWGPAKAPVLVQTLRPISEVPKRAGIIIPIARRVDLAVHVAVGASKVSAVVVEQPVFCIAAVPNRGELGVFATRDVAAGGRTSSTVTLLFCRVR